MRKTLLALAATTLCTLGAHAQSTVQLSGLADLYVGSMRMAGDASSRTTVGNSGMTTSWVGIKGSEDLGGGLKVNVAMTSFLRLTDGSQGRFPGDTFFSRDANIGFSGNFGSVVLAAGSRPTSCRRSSATRWATRSPSRRSSCT